MSARYRYYVVERGERARVFASAWPMERADAERALLARLAGEEWAADGVMLAAGSSETAPMGVAVLIIEADGRPQVALAPDRAAAVETLFELGVEGVETIVDVELLRLPRRARFSEATIAEMTRLRQEAGIVSRPIEDGDWCRRCGDARIGEGGNSCSACARLDALLETDA